jgi:hypothetical protein
VCRTYKTFGLSICLIPEPEENEENQENKKVDAIVGDLPKEVAGAKAEATLSFGEQWERAGMDDALADPSNLRPSFEELSMY